MMSEQDRRFPKNFIDGVEESARLLVQRNGEHPHVAMIPTTEVDDDGRRKVVVVALSVEKQRIPDVLRSVCAEYGAEEYVTVFDSWTVPREVSEGLSEEERASFRPSEHPERVSCITISYVHKRHGFIVRTFTYEQVAEERWVCGERTEWNEGEMYNRFSIWTPEQIVVKDEEATTGEVKVTEASAKKPKSAKKAKKKG
jgi:hypothetical protein